jgi:hypothetical protein
MILVALLLGGLGVADLVRSRSDRPAAGRIAGGVAVVVFALGALGVGVDARWIPVGALAIVGWLVATRPSAGRHRRGYAALGILVLAVAAGIAFGPALAPPSGPIVDWYAALPYAALADVSFTTAALLAGGVLFLFETANVIVGLTLRGEREQPPATAAAAVPSAPARRSWWHSTPEPATPAPAPVELKGGRFIGPLERVFLLALVLSGQFTAIAAVIAAKGIIRFPEIQRDGTRGSKAEYFLVGSFTSWALMLVVALLVTLGATVPS